MKRDPDIVFLVVATILAGLFWTVVYACKFYGFGLDAFDIGIYSNLAYNLGHGAPFYSSILQKNHLGEHFSPIMLVFAPLYRVVPGVHWLLGAQLAAWLTVPWLLRLVFREQGGAAAKGWVIWLTLAWLLYQPVSAAMNFPFHPSTLAMPFVVWAFREMVRGKWVRMTLLLVFLLTFKENLFLVWVGFGAYLVAHRRNTARGVVLILAGALSGWLILEVVMPLFRTGDWQHWTRFGPAFDWPHKLRYLLFLLAPLGFLPLYHWRAGLLALPALLPNLGSQMEFMYSRRHHYDDVLAALLFCAMAVILPRFRQTVESRLAGRRLTVMACLGFALIVAFTDLTPVRAAWRHWPSRQSIRLIDALETYDAAHPNDFLYLPGSLSPYFHRTLQAPLPEDVASGREGCRPGSLVVLATLADYKTMRKAGDLMAVFRDQTDRYERVQSPALFEVYRAR